MVLAMTESFTGAYGLAVGFGFLMCLTLVYIGMVMWNDYKLYIL